MARERRSRLPLLLFVVLVVAIVMWVRQEQAKRAAGAPLPDLTGPAPANQTPVAQKPAAKKTAAKKTAAKKAPAKKTVTARKQPVKVPAKGRA